jgi:hypothetical protein
MRHDSPLTPGGLPRGGRVLLETETLSAARGTVELTFPTSPYTRFQIEIDGIASTADAKFLMCRFGIQGAFPAGTDDFQFHARTAYSDSTTPATHVSGSPGLGYIAITDDSSNFLFGNTDPFMSGSFSLDVDPGDDTYRHPQVWWQGNYWSDDPRFCTVYGGGMYVGTAANVDERADAIQFQFDTDTIARGTFRLYGTE